MSKNSFQGYAEFVKRERVADSILGQGFERLPRHHTKNAIATKEPIDDDSVDMWVPPGIIAEKSIGDHDKNYNSF